MGKIISILICIIIIPIIIFNITLVIKAYFNPNEKPDFLGFKSFVIVSESMEPTIMTGDAIFVREVNPKELKVNDVISFRQGDSVNTHRIVEIISEDGKLKFRTKGDNNQNNDKDLVPASKVEGKYEFRIKGFGGVIEILKNKITLIVLLLIFVFIAAYQVRISKRKLVRKQKRYEHNKERLKENIKNKMEEK